MHVCVLWCLYVRACMCVVSMYVCTRAFTPVSEGMRVVKTIVTVFSNGQRDATRVKLWVKLN